VTRTETKFYPRSIRANRHQNVISDDRVTKQITILTDDREARVLPCRGRLVTFRFEREISSFLRRSIF